MAPTRIGQYIGLNYHRLDNDNRLCFNLDTEARGHAVRNAKLMLGVALVAVASLDFAPVYAAPPTTNHVLTFDAVNCAAPATCGGPTGYGPIRQSYGDIGGILDLSHRAIANWGNGALIASDVFYYGSGYGSLIDVVWAGTDANSTAGVPQYGEIVLRPLAGTTVTLNSLATAGWGGQARNVTFRVYDLNYQLLYAVSVVAPATGSATVNFGGIVNTSGIILQWGPDSYNTGIDNLSFSLGWPSGEAANYGYDAKARLTSVARTGAVNNGVIAQYAYDKADNRSNVATTGSPNTPPPPPPPPPNNPPVANADNAGTMGKCSTKTVNVTANDTDPDGDPLTVTGASATGDMTATVASASSVQIDSGQTAGAKSISYSISDGKGGTASSTISVTVSGGVCN
jgi:Bacterial Ig domain